MKKISKAQKILVQWIEVMPDGNPIIQTRKYNNESRADSFIETLPTRGVTNCTKKVTETIKFINETEVPEGQLSMDFNNI